MKQPFTKYRIRLLLHGDTPSEVHSVLAYLMTRSKDRELEVAIPDHPFFSIPGWSEIFQNGFGRAKLHRTLRTMKLTVGGVTTLEEQDISLLLRWLTPFIQPSTRPKRIAVFRNDARLGVTCLSYFIYRQELTMAYVDVPFMQIDNFQVAA